MVECSTLMITDLNIFGWDMVGMVGIVGMEPKPDAIDFCTLWEFAPWRRGCPSACPCQSRELPFVKRNDHTHMYICTYIFIICIFLFYAKTNIIDCSIYICSIYICCCGCCCWCCCCYCCCCCCCYCCCCLDLWFIIWVLFVIVCIFVCSHSPKDQAPQLLTPTRIRPIPRWRPLRTLRIHANLPSPLLAAW
jgi:hypothetical protein